MSRLRVSDQLRALQHQHNTLIAQQRDLERNRRVLLIRDGLLSAWCDSMTFIQLSLAIQQPEPAVEEEAAQFSLLLEKEVQLLQKLNCRPALSGQHPCSEDGASSRMDGIAPPTPLERLLVAEADTICPATTPMAYLHRFISQPPLEEAASMTAEQLASLMQQTTQKISIKLHQLESRPPWERGGMVAQMGEIWDRYMLAMRSLIMLGRQDVVEKAHAFNLETMQPEPAEAASHQAAQAAAMVPLLGLSEQQQEVIAVGMGLYYDLLQGIHNERQQINGHMTAAAAASEKQESVSRPASDGPEVGSPTCSSCSSELVTLPDRQEQLQKQQDLTNRLNLLLHKEYKLRMSAMGWFIGSLSYEQLSRLAVLSWPYPMRVLFLGTEIMQQHNKLANERLPPAVQGL